MDYNPELSKGRDGGTTGWEELLAMVKGAKNDAKEVIDTALSKNEEVEFFEAVDRVAEQEEYDHSFKNKAKESIHDLVVGWKEMVKGNKQDTKVERGLVGAGAILTTPLVAVVGSIDLAADTVAFAIGKKRYEKDKEIIANYKGETYGLKR